MKNYNVTANEELFNELQSAFISLENAINYGQMLGGVVQNSMTLSADELNDWAQKVQDARRKFEVANASTTYKLEKWAEKVIKYIKEGQDASSASIDNTTES